MSIRNAYSCHQTTTSTQHVFCHSQSIKRQREEHIELEGNDINRRRQLMDELRVHVRSQPLLIIFVIDLNHDLGLAE